MIHHGIAAEIIYWNILLEKLLPTFERNTDDVHFELVPYLYMIAGEFSDAIAQGKANAYVKSQLPLSDVLNNNSDYLGETKNYMDEVVAHEFIRLSPDDRLLFGISCKYEQWIPGIVLAGYIKRYFPDSRIVVGGFRDSDKAESILRICGNIDFAIWGEGEYPLFELCRALDTERPDLSSIPRLMFRTGESLQSTHIETSEFFDMNSRIFPDYHDYFLYLKASERRNIPVILPIESTRGCTWNACNFCVYSDGYKNRKKEADIVKEEVEYLLDKFDTPYFAFMDNDIVANDNTRLEQILDNLISVRQRTDVHFIAEVIHKDLKEQIMENFPRAGFGRLHFGYESLSENLLMKMRKKTNFSDNIFFVKFARKFGIMLPSANVICGAVGEEDTDILECIDNLHFLRFYFDEDRFRHNIIPLRIANHSNFHAMVPKEELNRFDQNEIYHLLPAEIKQVFDRFTVFDFSTTRDSLWQIFGKINDFYYEHSYTYTVSREAEHVIYREFFDSQPVVHLKIGHLAYRILQETNSNIMSSDMLIRSCTQHGAATNETLVFAALNFLKEKHLVYFNDAYQEIISVIDIDGESESK